jgi:hypothetical protein
MKIQSSVWDPWHFGADPDPHLWQTDPDPTTYFRCKNIFFLHIFSYNLPTGTLSLFAKILLKFYFVSIQIRIRIPNTDQSMHVLAFKTDNPATLK